jgi:hypothetical protein
MRTKEKPKRRNIRPNNLSPSHNLLLHRRQRLKLSERPWVERFSQQISDPHASIRRTTGTYYFAEGDSQSPYYLTPVATYFKRPRQHI